MHTSDYTTPVMYVDPTGEFVWVIVGAVVGVMGQFVGDLVTSALSGNWQFSSWEMYVGAAAGGAIGGMLSLIPGVGLYLGATAGGFASSAIGMNLENATGRSNYSEIEIWAWSAVSGSLNLATAGLVAHFKIPTITKGSHSCQKVYKTALTNTFRRGHSMALKTLGKGFLYTAVSNYSVGWLISSAALGAVNYIDKITQPIPVYPGIYPTTVY